MAAHGIDENVGRFDVLVDQPARVHLAEGGRERDGDAEKECRLQRLAEQPLEGRAPVVLEHQHLLCVAAEQLDRAVAR